MAGWHHWHSGHELGQTSGDSEGQGGLECCSPWSCKESDKTWERTTPEVCPSSCPLQGDTIKLSHPLSATPFSFCPQSFPASGTFQMSQLFTSDDYNTGVSASASVFPMRSQGWFPLRLTSLISLLFRGLSWVFSSTTVWRHPFFHALTSLQSSSHYCTWPLGRPYPWTIGTFVSRVMSLLSNTLSILVIAFLPRSNHLLISWLQLPLQWS